jgi:hypothetical protein
MKALCILKMSGENDQEKQHKTSEDSNPQVVLLRTIRREPKENKYF